MAAQGGARKWKRPCPVPVEVTEALYAWAAATLWRFADPAWLLPTGTFLGIALLWTRWRTAGRWLASLGGGGMLAVATLPIGIWAIASLENRFPAPILLPAEVDGIVVLGGSVSPGLSAARGQAQLNANGDRLVQFAALARRYPGARLVFTGYGKHAAPGVRSEAEVSAEVLELMGLDSEVVIFENESADTYENAVFTKAMVDPQPSEVWLLVTSAWHMPRAMGCFQAAGWNVTAYPAGYRTGGPAGLSVGYDPRGGFVSLSVAVHEWVGLLVYRLLGRTNAWFPGPTPSI
jgi:uncharacterized SAM-binding protein YcdF (DUF218 family)